MTGRIVWIVCIMFVVDMCQSRKHRDKTKEPRDQRDQSRGKDHTPNSRSSLYLADIIHEICLPPEMDRLVYRFQNDSHIFIGFDVMAEDTVYSMSWEIDTGNPEKLSHYNQNVFQNLSAFNVRNTVKSKHLLAATNQAQQDKFLRNLSTCSLSKITSKTCIIQSFASLARKMKEITFGQPCAESDSIV